MCPVDEPTSICARARSSGEASAGDTKELRFIGRVLPERADVYILPPITINNILPINDIVCEVTVSVQLSVLTAHVKVPRDVFTATNLETLKNYVEDTATLVVQALGFVLGCGYSVEITAEVSTMPPTIFGVGIDDLRQESDQKATGKAVSSLLRAVLSGKDGNMLALALADYSQAIRSPGDAVYLGYRAVESLRHAFSGVEPAQQWSSLREHLNVERSYFDDLIDGAQARRHGESLYVSGEMHMQALKKAQQIICRFADYKNSGKQQLPTDDYPMLK